jgi:kinesin family protein 2/24
MMIKKAKFEEHMLQPHTNSTKLKLSVCIRKRPLFEKEKKQGDIDAVSVANPQLKVHFPKVKVDGITKYLDNMTFTFDNTFNENENTREVYASSLRSLLPDLFSGGRVTMFAYGQTGSGKTYTMVSEELTVSKE